MKVAKMNVPDMTVAKMNTAWGLGAGLAASLLLLGPGGLAGQDWCEDRWGAADETACEEREVTLSPGGVLRVDGGRNGGISVEGWDRNEIRVVARISARDEDDDPRAILEDIQILTDGGEIRARGPSTNRDRSWSVSFQLMVPRDTDLRLEANNGGIALARVSGDIDFRTRNGGVSLEGVSGDVRGETRNGGVKVALDGDRWQGRGLDLVTRNGGVTVDIPRGYSADFETGTRNGSLSVDFPITVQGRIGDRLETTLGDGGPPVRVVTTNGSVRIRRR